MAEQSNNFTFGDGEIDGICRDKITIGPLEF
jgi:hypothetical protein